ncbi:MAG: DeoR family transcriptional regulator, partial [Gammaproteobacteria bacterium]|nr:DeoR family transcriptional regulator [Gammaproteobacteria bacterium]
REVPKLSLIILDIARQHGRVSVAEAVRVTSVSRNTIKDHFKSLVEQGYLSRHGAGRGTWYSLR